MTALDHIEELKAMSDEGLAWVEQLNEGTKDE